MLTDERLAALTATAKGTLTVRRINAPGHPHAVEPRALTVAFGFLRKAELVTVETVQRKGGNGPLTTASLTERGEHVLARATA